MPIYEQTITISRSYDVRVEAADEYVADEKIARMSDDEIETHREVSARASREDHDQFPYKVK